MESFASQIAAAEKALEEGRLDDLRRILPPLLKAEVPAAIRLDASFFDAGTPEEEIDRLHVEGMLRAAELGDPVARYRVGVFYDLGEYGVKVDKARASKIFRELALEGDAHCQWIYACELLWGTGSFEKDVAGGLEMLDRAIINGSGNACITKATFYNDGEFSHPIDFEQRDKYRKLAKECEEDSGYVYDPYA